MGREKIMQGLKKHGIYLAFSICELLWLLFFGVQVLNKDSFSHAFHNYVEETAEAGERICTEKIAVPEGIYQVTVQYEKGRGNGVCYARAGEAGVRSLYSDHVRLSGVQQEKIFDIYVNDPAEDLQIVIEPEEGDGFGIKQVQIATAANAKSYRIFSMVVKLLLMNVLAAVLCRRDQKWKWGGPAMAILAIGAVASAGLLEEYILYGHDLIFHLMRIEGLKEGLLAGGYPVRIQPNWFNGWGYPVSVMYGDQLLYFPALLRLVGVPLQDAYKCYIAAVNVGTAAVSYYAFFKIAGNRRTALFGSCLYTLAPYRLSCIYVRAAVGEYSAMLFLPLAALCFWYAFETEEKEKQSFCRFLAPVIGFTGLIQTHVLSCFLAAFAILLFCIMHWKKLLKKTALLYLAKVAGLTLLVNLWFLVPFLQYMGEDLAVTASHEMTPAFQRWGAGLAELFAVYWNGTLSASWGEIASVSQKFPKPVGTASLLMLGLGMALYDKEALKGLKGKLFSCGFFFVLFIFMASTVFPYYKISRLLPALGSLFMHIQFSYRFLSLVSLFGALLAVFAIMGVEKLHGKKGAVGVMAFVGILAVLQGAQLIYSAMYRGDVFLAYDVEALESNGGFAEEYLYEGSYGWVTEEAQAPFGEGIVIESYQKQYNRVTAVCKSQGEGAYLSLPLFYYIGYEAHDVATGDKMKLTGGADNNRIRVWLPADYEGTLQVTFEEPVSWRMAGAVSVFAILYLIFKGLKCCSVHLKRV